MYVPASSGLCRSQGYGAVQHGAHPEGKEAGRGEDLPASPAPHEEEGGQLQCEEVATENERRCQEGGGHM